MTPDEDAKESLNNVGKIKGCNEWYAWCIEVTNHDYVRSRLGVVPSEYRDCVRGHLNKWSSQHKKIKHTLESL